MSDQSQGEGWWEASDGKWYPPEQAPAPQPTAPQAAAGAPVATGAAGGGGGSAAKVVGIIVVLALIGGGVAFALTRSSGGGTSIKGFCDKAKALHDEIDLDVAFTDPSKVDKIADAFGQLDKAAPKEIKADMDTLDAAVNKARDAVKAGKSPSDGFNQTDVEQLDKAGHNVEDFGKKNCGSDFLLSSSSSDSSSSSSSSDSTKSSTGFNSSSSSSTVGQVADAVGTRDKLLELAQESGAVDDTSEPPIPAWTTNFPGLDFIGSALPATPTAVSGLTIVTSKAKDVDYLAFAVLDTHGQCSAGVLEFDFLDETVTNVVTVDHPTKCTADTVAEAEGY